GLLGSGPMWLLKSLRFWMATTPSTAPTTSAAPAAMPTPQAYGRRFVWSPLSRDGAGAAVMDAAGSPGDPAAPGAGGGAASATAGDGGLASVGAGIGAG